jgi:hypothetical protein
LRVEGDASIRVGPVTATNRPRAEESACTASPLDGRITALEDRIAALTAEHASQELVLGLLKGLGAPAEGELRLQYQTSGPIWAPAYRATLDATAAVVEMERQAQVSQSTGEDWSGAAALGDFTASADAGCTRCDGDGGSRAGFGIEGAQGCAGRVSRFGRVDGVRRAGGPGRVRHRIRGAGQG